VCDGGVQHCAHLLLSGLSMQEQEQEPSALAAAMSKRPVKEHMRLGSMHIRHVIAVYTASTAPAALSQIRFDPLRDTQLTGSKRPKKRL
jgi:hypothetical protein